MCDTTTETNLRQIYRDMTGHIDDLGWIAAVNILDCQTTFGAVKGPLRGHIPALVDFFRGCVMLADAEFYWAELGSAQDRNPVVLANEQSIMANWPCVIHSRKRTNMVLSVHGPDGQCHIAVLVRHSCYPFFKRSPRG